MMKACWSHKRTEFLLCWLCEYIEYVYWTLLHIASLMRSKFPKGPSDAPRHSLSKLYDVPVGFVPPLLLTLVWTVSCFVCGSRRVAVALHRMIYFILKMFLTFTFTFQIQIYGFNAELYKNVITSKEIAIRTGCCFYSNNGSYVCICLTHLQL